MAVDRTLTIDEVAAAIRTSKKTVYRRIHAGLIKTVDIGSGSVTKLRVRESALNAYLDRCEVAAI